MMGAATGIGWTNKTWNPWHGCHHVSPGCEHCYMFAQKRQYGQDPERVVRAKPATFNAPLKWHDPALVFTCSWSDFFIAEADEWRPEAWQIIERTPHLTYQILTKRPARIPKATHPDDEPHGNVWLGVSIESRQYLYRADVLRELPAAVRFLSLEPLLEDLGRINLDGIGWVIIGGESGARRRFFSVGWLQSVVYQCRDAGVPVFVKQDYGLRPGTQGGIPDELWIHEFPVSPSARRG
jgi:protein gp37